MTNTVMLMELKERKPQKMGEGIKTHQTGDGRTYYYTGTEKIIGRKTEIEKPDGSLEHMPGKKIYFMRLSEGERKKVLESLA
ncbi:MAG: hypothetical protein V1811_00340 [Candidatus Micrarchaeota archaeon]